MTLALSGNPPLSASAVNLAVNNELTNNWFPVQGVTNGSNAVTGGVGEFISGNLSSASPVSVTNGAPIDIISISLTPGDWDVWGSIGTLPAATTLTQLFAGWISATSATAPSSPNTGAYFSIQPPQIAQNASVLGTGIIRVLQSTTRTIFLSTQVNFSTSTLTAYGYLAARRVR